MLSAKRPRPCRGARQLKAGYSEHDITQTTLLNSDNAPEWRKVLVHISNDHFRSYKHNPKRGNNHHSFHMSDHGSYLWAYSHCSASAPSMSKYSSSLWIESVKRIDGIIEVTELLKLNEGIETAQLGGLGGTVVALGNSLLWCLPALQHR